ncbi:hypothetical protein F2Q70_00032891 [Brassica cretica]|uniref:Uncharacterized protein n=1 Tax=Brassica cretica TaxID=69181 RepID=A0A8S9FFP0_BRACR|nr:hypothetical protein F2Q70_00032891 [Brassica cretica]
MEGVGGRLGRSSTRYGGPATVFTGPVRKWKKKWVHVSPSTKKLNHSSSSSLGGLDFRICSLAASVECFCPHAANFEYPRVYLKK